MKKTKLTRSLLAACSIVALSVVLSGCLHSSDDSTTTGPDMTGEPDPAIAERAAINSAITTARTTVAGLTDDASDAAINAAEMAVAAAKKAVADAANVPAEEKAAFNTTVATLEGNLTAKKTSIAEARKTASDAMAKANAKLGKDLHAALGPPDAADTTALDNATVTLSATGLAVDADTGAGALATDAGDPASVTLKAGDPAGALGSWNGTNYAHTDTGTKVVNEAVVYSNKGPDGSQPFSGTGGKYTLITTAGDTLGHIELGTTDHPVARAMATAFTHTGTQNHPIPDNNVALIVRGTYDGAPGQFRCTGICTSTNDGEEGPSALGGTWHFKPDSGAMVSQPDTDYLYFGWWVSKDKDGVPTAASAFRGTVGTTPAATNTPITLSDAVALTGSATYAGKAAGKFAMSNPLDGTGSGGHFTADAMLTAKFGAIAPDANNGGISGTIENFRLNDGSEDPGWSVTLNHAPWGTTGAFESDADTTNTTAEGTVWSIDGNPAPESGTWSGQMYDELPGLTTDTPPGDGNDTPTTVSGTFYSEFSTIGRMVGAFGADKQ